MSEVLLINPPHPFREGVPVPLSLTYLGAVLEEEGFEVDSLDLLVSSFSPEKVREKISSTDPQIVGITSVTRTYPISVEILKYCKEAKPSVKTVIGGPHVTFTAEETLQEFPWVDFVVRGEGEYTFRELSNRIVDGGDQFSVDGIAYRNERGKVIFTGERGLIEDLDELPFPKRNLMPLSKYRSLGSRCGVITSRGCPFGCVFCVAPKMFGGEVRFRSPDLVVDEIEEILDLGFEINLADDTFTLNHDHVYSILDEILDRGLEFEWTANARVDTVDRDLLKRMKDAGCNTVFYGVESGNPEVLEKSGKGINLEQVERAVELSKDVGLDVITSYILGLPGENRETLQETLDFADQIDTKHTVHVLAPLPGTPLYENREEYGIELISEDWERINADEPVTRVITEDGVLSPGELENALDDYLRRSGESLEDSREEAEDGDEEAKKKVEKWDRLEFLTSVLQKDLIEKYGRIKLETEENLDLERSARLMENELLDEFEDYYFSIKNELIKQVEEGNLSTSTLSEEGDRFLVWDWKEL